MRILEGIAKPKKGDLSVSVNQTKVLIRQRGAHISMYHPLADADAAGYLAAHLPIPEGWSFSDDLGEVVQEPTFSHRVRAPLGKVSAKKGKSGLFVASGERAFEPADWNKLVINNRPRPTGVVDIEVEHKLPLVALRDVCLLFDDNGFVLFRGNKILPHTGAYPVFRPRRREMEEIPELYLAGDLYSHDNIAHFLLDSLCRARMAVDRYGIREEAIGFPAYNLAYCTDLQRRLFPQSRRLERRTFYRIGTLYLTGYCLQMGSLHPANACDPGFLNWLQQAAPPVTDPRLPERMFISRRDSNKRPLINEAKIESRALAAGFQPIVMSEHSAENQMRLFANAKVIIAPHGAALANLAFCKPGTRVVEMFNGDGAGTDAFQRIGTALGLKIVAYFGSGVAADHPTHGRRGWQILPRSFERLVESEFLRS